MDLNSKKIGNITEVESILAFLKLGCNVLQPYGDCERYDFVVDVDGALYKVQCKTSSTDNNGESIKFSCRSAHRVNGKCINEKYTSKEVDFFCTTWNGKCYLIPQKDCFSRKTLRFTKPKNCQNDGIFFAEDYEIEKVLNSIRM